MSPHLHIVSFNVPWPADYGGVIDVFYRLKALSEAGYRIHLHCFTYGRDEAPELVPLCEEVRYYPRKTSPRMLLRRKPYIVASRENQDLIHRLSADHYPILLEGLHCCATLEALRHQFPQRTIIVRAHNVEHDYYHLLAHSEANPLKKWYLSSEASKLRSYEPVLQLASAILAVSAPDAAHFAQYQRPVYEVPCLATTLTSVTSQEGRGDFLLFHGDLSVPDNERAALYLITNHFGTEAHPLIIAGRCPSQALQKAAEKAPQVELRPNLSNDEMQRLQRQAQVTILLTSQPTGLKLKLLNSLFQGRHILVNSLMVQGTPFAPLCTVADTPQAQLQALEKLFQTPFTQQDIAIRQKAVSTYCSPLTIVETCNRILTNLSEQH